MIGSWRGRRHADGSGQTSWRSLDVQRGFPHQGANTLAGGRTWSLLTGGTQTTIEFATGDAIQCCLVVFDQLFAVLKLTKEIV